jgi:hypothetical protein
MSGDLLVAGQYVAGQYVAIRPTVAVAKRVLLALSAHLRVSQGNRSHCQSEFCCDVRRSPCCWGQHVAIRPTVAAAKRVLLALSAHLRVSRGNVLLCAPPFSPPKRDWPVVEELFYSGQPRSRSTPVNQGVVLFRSTKESFYSGQPYPQHVRAQAYRDGLLSCRANVRFTESNGGLVELTVLVLRNLLVGGSISPHAREGSLRPIPGCSSLLSQRWLLVRMRTFAHWMSSLIDESKVMRVRLR